MLRALGDPLSFVLLLVFMLVAVVAHGWVQCLVADRTGDRRPRQERRITPDPRRHVDPFGAVAGLIAGFGWARPLEPAVRAGRGPLVAVFLSGAALNVLLAAAGLVAFRAMSGTGVFGASALLLQSGVQGLPVAQIAALLFGMMNLYVAALSLVPIPPLDGGRLLFALAPRTSGWQKAEYHLVEQNFGLVAVLVLLLVPLGGPQALLPTVLDDVVSPFVRLVTGG